MWTCAPRKTNYSKQVSARETRKHETICSRLNFLIVVIIRLDELLVTNQSKLDLNVQLSVKEPFHLITSTEEHAQSMQIVLIDGGTTKIRVFFSFNGDTEDCYSKNYSGVLRLEYQEHPNQVNFLVFSTVI